MGIEAFFDRHTLSVKLSDIAAFYAWVGSDRHRVRLRSRLVWASFAVILALVLLPVGADAASGYDVRPGGAKIILSVGNMGDYVLSVSANEKEYVRIAIKRPSSGVEYSTKGYVSSHRIHATFGTMGSVDVRLDLTRNRSEPPFKGRCKGPGARYQEGVYRGEIQLFDTRNLPRVSINRGRVYIKRRFRRVCKQRHMAHKRGDRNRLPSKVEAGILTVTGKSDGHTVILEALDFALKRDPARSGGSLLVEAYERRDGVLIARRTSIPIDPTSFIMSARGENPQTIEIELPKPFAGSAFYSHWANSFPSWTGDLSVNLPGGERISLTGFGFSAVFCRSSWMEKLKNCDRR